MTDLCYNFAIPISFFFLPAEQVASTNVQVCNDITSAYPEGSHDFFTLPSASRFVRILVKPPHPALSRQENVVRSPTTGHIGGEKRTCNKTVGRHTLFNNIAQERVQPRSQLTPLALVLNPSPKTVLRADT